MPGAVHELSRRIKAISSTEQLTKTMKMIATARLAGARERIAGTAAYIDSIAAIITDLVSLDPTSLERSPLVVARQVVKHDLYMVFSSDRGLCGSFNHNLVALTERSMEERAGVEHAAMPLGRKGREYLRRLRCDLLKGFASIPDDVPASVVRSLAEDASALFLHGEVDEVYLVYSTFVNVLVQRPTLVRLLPVTGEPLPGSGADRPPERGRHALGSYIYEPSPRAVLERLIPRYIQARIYRAALQSKAAENAARMTAMSAATDNAEEIIHHLTLEMNRARQARITNELAEIVGGASALE